MPRRHLEEVDQTFNRDLADTIVKVHFGTSGAVPNCTAKVWHQTTTDL